MLRATMMIASMPSSIFYPTMKTARIFHPSELSTTTEIAACKQLVAPMTRAFWRVQVMYHIHRPEPRVRCCQCQLYALSRC